MKNCVRLSISTFFYMLACILFAIYVIISLDVHKNLSTFGELFFYGTIILFIYCGSRFIMMYASKNKKNKIIKITVFSFLLLYFMILSKKLIFDINYGRKIYFIFNCEPLLKHTYLDNNLNLIPFKTIMYYLSNNTNINYSILNLLGNLFLFTPIALFSSICFSSKINSFSKYIIFNGCFVLFFEISQMIFLCGSCDIDDFILNMSGIIIIYWIIRNRKIKKFINKLLATND